MDMDEKQIWQMGASIYQFISFIFNLFEKVT